MLLLLFFAPASETHVVKGVVGAKKRETGEKWDGPL
jgi:hypothetical protein